MVCWISDGHNQAYLFSKYVQTLIFSKSDDEFGRGGFVLGESGINDFLNKNKNVFPAKTIKLSGLQTEICENSRSHSFL